MLTFAIPRFVNATLNLFQKPSIALRLDIISGDIFGNRDELDGALDILGNLDFKITGWDNGISLYGKLVKVGDSYRFQL